MEHISISQAKSIIKKAIEVNIPIFLWGAPGIGKSAIVTEIAQSLNKEIEDVRTSQLDSVEIRGFPYRDRESNTLKFSPPHFIKEKGNGLLFLDELNLAPQTVLAACYQLILDRRVGEAKLGKDWQIICAGNRRSDKSYTQDLGAALHSRLMHIHIQANLKDWTKWALQENIDTRLINFLNFKPNLFIKDVPKNKNECWPNPRSWTRTAKLIDHKHFYTMAAGLVGEGPANEMNAYIKIYQKLPSWNKLMLNPSNHPLPDIEDPTMAYAIAGMWGEHTNYKNAPSAFQLLERFNPETQTVAMRILQTREETKKVKIQVTNTESFLKWVESEVGQSILNSEEEEE